MLPRNLRGWTLIELTVVLIVLSILFAVLAPVVGRYAHEARRIRARKDVRTIGAAVWMHLAETGEPMFLQVGSGGGNQPPDRNSATRTNRMGMLVGDGDIPMAFSTDPQFTSWTAHPTPGPGSADPENVAGGMPVTDFLENHIVTNRPFGDPANRYRTPSDMVNDNPDRLWARDESGGLNSEFSWRGPYLGGPIGPDPWGNRYAVNVRYLDPGANVAGPLAGYTADVIVLSAGPNGVVETPFEVEGNTPGGDDIIYILGP